MVVPCFYSFELSTLEMYKNINYLGKIKPQVRAI